MNLNSTPILDGLLSFPEQGTWVLDSVIDADAMPTASAITIEDEDGRKCVGTLIDGGAFGSRAHVVAVGGSGGLRTTVQAAHYVAATAQIVLAALLAEAKELLDPTSDPAVLATALPSWTRFGGKASDALTELTTRIGARWRVTPAGSVWVGSPTFAMPAEEEAVIIDARLGHRSVLAAPSGLTLRPGLIQSGARLGRVEYSLGSPLRATYWLSSDG